MRARLFELGEAGWKQALSPRRCKSLMQGYRERITDVELPHIRALPQSLPPLFAAAATRTEAAGFDGVELHYAQALRWPRSFQRRIPGRTVTADPLREGCACRLRCLPPSASVKSDFNVGCRFLAEECIEGGDRARRDARRGRRLRERGDGFRFDFARGKVRGRGAPGRQCRRLSLYGAERLRVHAPVHFGRARAV